jgi:hypothetical protein
LEEKEQGQHLGFDMGQLEGENGGQVHGAVVRGVVQHHLAHGRLHEHREAVLHGVLINPP